MPSQKCLIFFVFRFSVTIYIFTVIHHSEGVEFPPSPSIYHLRITFQHFPSAALSPFNSFCTFKLGNVFRLQGRKERQRECYDRHCPQGGVHESFQGHRASLGWLTECQLPPPNQPAWGPQRYLTQRSAQIWPALITAVNTTCWPAYITPALAVTLSAFLYLSLTHTHTF